MAMIFNYFDNWKGADLVCPQCGWKGKIDPEQVNEYRELFDFTCPKCATMLAIVNFPTETEIKEHSDALSEEERHHYGQRFELDAQFETHHLAEPSQLPDIDDDPLVLVWDFETDPRGELSGPSYTAIKHNGRSICRERVYYECVGRFGEVVDVLQRKYGERLKDLAPTGASLGYLGGDDLRAWEKLERFRARMSPHSVDPELRLHALARAGDGAANNFLRYRREIGEHCLQSEDQLPTIDGELVVIGCTLAEDPPRVRVRREIQGDGRYTQHFDWDKQPGDGFLYLCLCHKECEIWREAAPQDHPGRIDGDAEDALVKRYSGIADLLKQKYGSRTKDVVMTYASEAYIGRYREHALVAARARCFPDTADIDNGAAIQEAVQRAIEYGATIEKARLRAHANPEGL